MSTEPTHADGGRPSDDEHADSRIAAALARYLDRVTSGETVELDQFLDSQADLKPELAGILGTLDEIRGLSEGRGLPETIEKYHQFGDFRILRQAGRGGMGIVYEAIQMSLDRRVALKILPSGYIPDSKSVARFYREAKVAASLHHPSIVEVHALGVEDGVPYYAMEYVQGYTLRELLKSMRRDPEETGVTPQSGKASPAGPPCPPDGLQTPQPMGRGYHVWLAEMFAEAAEGLQVAHTSGVIHRDLKPSNLILDHGRERDAGGAVHLRILDFGLALVEGQTGLTLPRERPGTPLYMSPEQTQESSRRLGPGTDIYSLGATLYEMMVWRPPFRGRSSAETLERIVQRDPIAPRKVRPQVPRDLETIVLKCLEKKPEHRYATAEALAQDLRRFVRGDPVEARPCPWPQRVARRSWRARRRILEAAGVLALVLSLGIVALGHSAKERARRQAEYDDRVLSAVKELIRVDLRSPWTRLGRAEPESFDLLMLESGPVLESRQDRGTNALLEAGPELCWAGPDLAHIAREAGQSAIRVLEEAVRLYGESPAADYLLSRALWSAGHEDRAGQHLARALEREPGFAPALALGRILEEEGRWTPTPEQRRLVSEALHSIGDWGRTWIQARRAVHGRRWKEAAAAYESLLTDAKPAVLPYPGWDLEVLAWSGITHFRAGIRERFTGAFSTVHALWPEAIEPVLLLGKAACLNRSWGYAEKLFRALYHRTAGSQRDEVAASIAEVYREVGNYQRARIWAQSIRDPRSRRMLLSHLLCLLGSTQEAYDQATWLLQPEQPADMRARLLQGNALVKQQRFEEARVCFEQACRQDPTDSRPRVGLAICLEAQDRLDAATGHLREALKLDPDQPQAHYNLARILAHRGRMQEATESYERALVADANCVLACNNLGILQDRAGDLEEARRCYEAAARLCPHLGLALYNLAWTNQRQNRLVDAAETYQEALRQGLENEAIVHENLGPAFMEQNRLPDAIKEYRVALDLHPDNARTHNNLAVALHRQGNLDEALPHYHKAVKLEPDWKNLRNALGYAYLLLKQYDEAEAEYRKVLELDPDFVHAHNDLAVLMLESGRPFPRGESLKAEVRRLEDASLLPGATQPVHCLLRKYREALAPDLASYASVDAVLDAPEDLVPEDAIWRFFVGESSPSHGLEWTRGSFDDSGWRDAPGGVDLREDKARFPVLDLEGRSVYLRHLFEVTDRERIRELILSVTASGGFVAYLNGEEVGRLRAGTPDTVPGDDAQADWEEHFPGTTRPLALDVGTLRAGNNVLALHGVHFPGGDLPFHLLPVLEARVASDARSHERALKARTRFQEVASGPETRVLRLYFEAGLLQRQERHEEAAARYREVLEADESRPEPFLRLAECLVRSGIHGEAESILRRALNLGMTRHPPLWNAWLRVTLVDLGWSPLTILGVLPDSADSSPQGADSVWLLERLRDGEDIRVNCGGLEYRDEQDRLWSRDRFFLGGWTMVLPGLADPGVTLTDPPLYESERYFFEPLRILPGYRIPLPEGEYRITLLFVEGWFKVPGSRRFDVLLEGKEVLTDYEPLDPGFGVPFRLEVRMPVLDGALNIDFGKRVENPKISAFLIEHL